MSKRHRRQAHREGRVLPPPEAAQHHRPWPMQLLLVAGPEGGGIDADEFEAALQLVETFHALTQGLGVAGLPADFCRIGGNYSGSMSDRDAERCACWFEWAMHLPAGLPARLVLWIEDDAPIVSVAVLRHACRLWSSITHRRAKDARYGMVDTQPPDMLTIPATNCVRTAERQTVARPPNLPVGSFQPRPGVLAYAACSTPTPAPRHALPPRPAPTTRR